MTPHLCGRPIYVARSQQGDHIGSPLQPHRELWRRFAARGGPRALQGFVDTLYGATYGATPPGAPLGIASVMCIKKRFAPEGKCVII